jgi:hypothetical protein
MASARRESIKIARVAQPPIVDRQGFLRHRMRTQQVPLNGDLRELGFKARAAPATVSGVPSSKTTGWKAWEGDDGTSSREPGNLLVVVAHRTAGVR